MTSNISDCTSDSEHSLLFKMCQKILAKLFYKFSYTLLETFFSHTVSHDIEMIC